VRAAGRIGAIYRADLFHIGGIFRVNADNLIQIVFVQILLKYCQYSHCILVEIASN
jgi:hypothetical protein